MKRNLLPAFIPYLAVGIGLFVFHNAWAAILTYHAGMITTILLSRKSALPKHIFQSNGYTLTVISVLAGAGGGVLLYVLLPFLSVPPDIGSYMRSIGLNAASWHLFLGYYALMNPVIEEYFWRGYLGSSAKQPVLHDFLFAGYHVIVLAGNIGTIWLVAVFLVLSGAAWYWRQLTRLTGGLLAATASHMAADITVILAIYSLTAG